MRKDMKKLLCERPRVGHSNPSLKTGKRLDPRLDYDSYEYDWGPSRFSIGRRRQHGWEAKQLNENLKPLKAFLYSTIGRLWDDVYSEIREHLCPNKAIDFHVLFHLDHMVDRDVYIENGVPYLSAERRWGRSVVRDLYVHPDTGILSIYDEPKVSKRIHPPDSLHWHGNLWFKKEIRRDRAKCGCVRFFEDQIETRYISKTKKESFLVRRLAFTLTDDTKCIHGNPPIAHEIWFVVEYGYHSPDEVLQVIHWGRDPVGTAIRYGLSVDNPTYIIYYRDAPDALAKHFEVRRKTANKKELKIIRNMLQ